MRLSEKEFARLAAKLKGAVPESLWKRAVAGALPFADGPPRMFSVTLGIEAKVKKRPRVFRIVRPDGVEGEGRPLVVATTPRKTREFEAALRDYLAMEMRRVGMEVFPGPVAIGLRMVFAGDPSMAATAKPLGDIDNLEKAVLDAMNGIVFADDRMVVAKFTQKVLGDAPSLTVTVAEAVEGVVSELCFVRTLGALAAAERGLSS